MANNKKEAYYFSHDSNARNDDKILAVRMKLGMEGYGIYWSIIEKMRENADYMCIKDYNVIAFDLRVSSEKIKSLVEDFNLFIFTENSKKFYSESFLERMATKDYKSKKAKKAAEIRWNKPSEEKENEPDKYQLLKFPESQHQKAILILREHGTDFEETTEHFELLESYESSINN